MRLEYKYKIPVSKLDLLRKRISAFVEPDLQYHENSEYSVKSIYFDTSQLRFYNEKIEGLKDRRKIRIRWYNELNSQSVLFLEIKKKVINFISKNRAPVFANNYNDFLSEKVNSDFVLDGYGCDNAIGDSEKFIHYLSSLSLRPIILIVYEREAFFSKFDNRLRITLDKNLRYSFPDFFDMMVSEENFRYPMPIYFIMEIKFSNGFPKWLQQIISEFEILRTAISKYTICIDDEKNKLSHPSNLILGINSYTKLFSTKHQKEEI